MVSETNINDKLSRLERRQRDFYDRSPARLTAPGTQPPAWTVMITGPADGNRYPVRLVEIIAPGVEPIPAGGTMQAFNIAEPFMQDGILPVGTYAIMWRIGGHYVIQVKG